MIKLSGWFFGISFISVVLFISSCGETPEVNIASCASDCYMEGTAPNYAQELEVGTERLGPDNATLTLQYADGSSGFKIWKEKGGTKILNATGLVTNGWQKQLTRRGDEFSTTDFTTGAYIAGRVCPTHVFLSYSNMTATGRCLYYDAGNNPQALNSQSSGVYAEDYLSGSDNPLSGNGANPSWYEGNIKTCADKGMRLPAAYETRIPTQSSNIPTDANPTFAGSTNGVPHFQIGSGFNWTASAFLTTNPNPYWLWGDNAAGTFSFSNTGPAVRCVLP